MGCPKLSAIAVASLSLFAGACAQDGLSIAALTGQPAQPTGIVTSATPVAKETQSEERVQAELAKATTYWGEVYARDPSDPQAAYNYARNLKAKGEKHKALAVLQAAYEANPTHKGILSEYGRLALEFDQITLAQKLLEKADDPSNPDWRIISARGTALAKQGLYGEAIPYFETALKVAPEQPSVMNNLGLAYTMVGHPEKAEPLLRKASAAPRADERVSQNLALVLSLKGKEDGGETAEPAPMTTGAVAPASAKKSHEARKPVASGWTVDVFAHQ